MFTTTIEVTKAEPDDMTDDDLNPDSTVDSSLYADHIVKGEMVIGPTVLVKPNGTDQFQKTTGYANQASRRNIEDNKIKRTVSSSNIKKSCSLQSKAKDVQRSHKTKNTPNKNTAKVPSKLEFICDYCKRVFHTKWNITQHISWRHNSKIRETCNICFKTFPYKSKLMRHMKDFHGEKTVFPCDQCHKQFGLKKYLNRHKLAVHSQKKKTIMCACGKNFNNQSSYSRHKRCFCKDSSEINIVTCKFCLRQYHNVRLLNYHIKVIHIRNRKVKQYYCDYCNKCYKKKFLLAGHIDAKHMKLALYVCEICGKCFSYLASLYCHLKHHSGRKSFSCKKCKKTFKSKPLFQRHEKACTYVRR